MIVGHQSVAALAVADGHAFSAAPADDQSLQQRGPLAGGTGGALLATCLGVLGERAEVVLVLLEADVSRVRIGDQRCPLLPWERLEADLAFGGLARAAPSVDERAGVARVVQHLQHAPVIQRHPRQLAPALAGADPDREQQPVAVERLDYRARGPGPLERAEQVAQRVLHASVGIEHDVAGRVIDQADGKLDTQLAAAGFGELPAAQPRADEVQLGL